MCSTSFLPNFSATGSCKFFSCKGNTPCESQNELERDSGLIREQFNFHARPKKTVAAQSSLITIA
jgi:hypothetical protein